MALLRDVILLPRLDVLDGIQPPEPAGLNVPVFGSKASLSPWRARSTSSACIARSGRGTQSGRVMEYGAGRRENVQRPVGSRPIRASTGLEQARNHGQRDERTDEARDRPLTRTCSPRDRVRDRHRAEGHDRVDEVEDLPGTTATGKEPKAACHGDDEREDEESLEAFGQKTAR
jgi:hypothetical protein